jgi:hypothetical protein
MSRIFGAGGGGGGGCFLGHTLVRTPDGQRAIETLQPGDLVLSFDDRGQLHQAKILKVHVHEGERVVRYSLWGGAVLDATPNHWVLNQYNAFVEIDTLGPDDCLVDENGHLRPIVDRADHGRGTVYNLTVEGHHTFIAGGIRVHNAGLGLGIAGAGGGGSRSSSGKGGGGGSQTTYTPTEAGDNLNSTQYASLVDLISEGEIQGLKNGYQSVFIDNVPLQNADGSYNFKNVTVDYRYGTQNQSYIPITADVENEKPVSVQVQYGAPIVRSITSSTVNAARITITVPALQEFANNGDINGSSFSFEIQVQYNGGGYNTVIADTVSGRSGDQFQRDYLVGLSGAFPVNIRLVRTSADSGSAKIQNAFSWSSYTEITYAKLRYPNSAVVALRVDAEQFSSIPGRSYLIRGIKVRIPSNAMVDSTTGRLIYSGVWNGSFGAAQWTTDPAWILWDLLTSSRYGFGDHIQAAQLDKWAFYAASGYASELVPNGFGGQEPRFSCNVNIQTQEDAYKLINDMSSIFRAMPYWSTGALTVSQDRPSDPAYLFTLANVSEEGFSYQGGSLKTRPTVAVVSWLNLDKRDIDYEVVEDQEAIGKYGVITREISAFACTSRGQAHRLGEWLLYSEWYENEVVSFTASIDAGVLVRPGQIIEISDPTRAGARRGGRLVSATTTAVTVDDASSLAVSSTATLSVILPDGSVESRAVQTIQGDIITLATALTAAPNANSVWIYQTSDIQTSTWRVLSVQEQDGAQYAISALAYNASKYGYIERDLQLEQRDVTNLNIIPPAPTNLQALEALYENNGRALSKLVLSWQAAPGVNQYRVRWRPQNGNWSSVTETRLDYEILDTGVGRYEIEVYSINGGLRQSVEPASLTVNAFGKTAPPATPTGVSLIPIDGASAILSWDRSTELDVLLGGKVLIRHNVALTGALWEESQEIVAAAAGSQTQKQVPLLEGTYLVKFEDDGGRRSLVASTVVVDLPTPQPRLLVQTYAEETETPPFNGNYTDMFYVESLAEAGGASGIIISTGEDVDDMATDGNWDGLASIDSVGGVLESGEYEFASTYAFPGVFDANLRRRLVTLPYIPGDFWDDKLEDIDTWDLIDGTGGDRVNALTYVRTTQDDPSGTPTWSAWREFSNAIVRGRGFQFKTIASSTDPTQNIIIEELGVEMELQQRTEQSATLTSGVGTYTVTFENAFYSAPSVGVTGFDMATGDYFTIGSVTRTGFQVTFRNSAGSAVSRQFTYTAIGFGRQI